MYGLHALERGRPWLAFLFLVRSSLSHFWDLVIEIELENIEPSLVDSDYERLNHLPTYILLSSGTL